MMHNKIKLTSEHNEVKARPFQFLLRIYITFLSGLLKAFVRFLLKQLLESSIKKRSKILRISRRSQFGLQIAGR